MRNAEYGMRNPKLKLPDKGSEFGGQDSSQFKRAVVGHTCKSLRVSKGDMLNSLQPTPSSGHRHLVDPQKNPIDREDWRSSYTRLSISPLLTRRLLHVTVRAVRLTRPCQPPNSALRNPHSAFKEFRNPQSPISNLHLIYSLFACGGQQSPAGRHRKVASFGEIRF